MYKHLLLYFVPVFLIIACSKPQQTINKDNPVPPLVDTAKAIVVFNSDCCNKIIEAYSPNGLQLWRKTLPFNSGLSPQASYMNGKVYFSYGSGIYAWDTKTGNQIWFGQARGVTSAPVAVNNTIYVTTNLGEILEIDPETGVLKQNPAQISQLVPYPPFYNDSVLYVFSATSLAQYSVHAFDLRLRRVKWTAPVGYNPSSNLMVIDGKLGLINGTKELIALNLSSGTVAWKRTEAPFLSFTYDNNTVYAMADSYPNKVFAFNTGTGTQSWVWDPGWSAPLPELRVGYIYEKGLIVEAFRGNTRVLYTFDTASGQLQKSQNDPGGVLNYYYDPTIVGKKLYRFSVRNIGAQFNQVMIFDAATHSAIDSFRVTDANYNFMTVVK